MAKLDKNIEKSYESKSEKKERQISELKQFWKLWEEFANTLSTYQTLDEFMKENNLSIEDVKDYFLWKNDIFNGKNKIQLLSTIIRYGEEDFIIGNLGLLKLNSEEKYSLVNMIARIKPSVFDYDIDFLKSFQLPSNKNIEVIKKLIRTDNFYIKNLKEFKLSLPDLYDIALLYIKNNLWWWDAVCDNIDIFENLSAYQLENIIYEILKNWDFSGSIKENKKVMDKVNFDAILHRLIKEREYYGIICMVENNLVDSWIDEETTKAIIEWWATDVVLKYPDKFWLKKE